MTGEERIARLATISPDGRPALVPICFAMDGDTLYTAIDQKPKTTDRLARLRNIARDPRVTVLVDHYEEDWTKVWWVRLDGLGREVDQPAERQHALALLASKYEQYRASPPEGPVIAVDVDRRVRWSGRS